jgi:spermidine synthase
MALTNTAKGLWFQEDLFPDIAYGFRVSAILHQETSAWQEILVLDTPALGKVLVLDGIVQCAQKDEAIYHEMLAHSGVFLRLALGTPETGLEVLVVGGGDGGVARECLKHDRVAGVTVVDIDPRVRETVLMHFPELPAGAYDDPRLRAVDADAAGFVRGQRNRFDLIVADTPDPVGAAKPLFGRDFVVDCHVATCSYLGGWFTWLSAEKDAPYPQGEPGLRALRALFERAALDVRWYSPELQFAASVLPAWCVDDQGLDMARPQT